MYACVLAFHPGYLLLNPPVGILQAGIVIAQEAGGFVTGSKDTPHDGVITEAILTGRRYLVIRGVAGTPVRTISFLFETCVSHLYYAYPHAAIPTEQEESSLDVQKRLAREFYDTVQDIPLDE